ncbi:MAG: hypothetical protein GXP01_00375 [Alphaproteobacteria bacterium]|nr:hypothetical protein [Alphaproteobacteria bacterium]
MSLINSLFGGGAANFWTVTLALAFVLILIVFLVWILKFILSATRTVGLGRNRRIGITDSIPVDAKRHLILIRRDDVEHLILTGGTNDLIVEAAIPLPPLQEGKPAPSAAAARRSGLALGALTRERGVPAGFDPARPEARPDANKKTRPRLPLAPGLVRREPVPATPDTPPMPKTPAPAISDAKNTTGTPARPSTGMSALEKLREMARGRTPASADGPSPANTGAPGLLRPVTRHRAAPAPGGANNSSPDQSDSAMSGGDAPVHAPDKPPAAAPAETTGPAGDAGRPDNASEAKPSEKSGNKTDSGKSEPTVPEPTVPDPADWQAARPDTPGQTGSKAK